MAYFSRCNFSVEARRLYWESLSFNRVQFSRSRASSFRKAAATASASLRRSWERRLLLSAVCKLFFKSAKEGGVSYIDHW